MDDQSDGLDQEVADLDIRRQRIAPFRVIHDKRAEHGTLCRSNRNGPADLQTVSDGERPECGPTRIVGDVGHRHPWVRARGPAAGTCAWADMGAFHSLDKCQGQARSGAMLQMIALLVQEQDIAQKTGRGQRLHLADNRVQRDVQRCFFNRQFKDSVLGGPPCCRAIACLGQAGILDGNRCQTRQAFQAFDRVVVVSADLRPVGAECRDRNRSTNRRHDQATDERRRVSVLRDTWIGPHVRDRNGLAAMHDPP